MVVRLQEPRPYAPKYVMANAPYSGPSTEEPRHDEGYYRRRAEEIRGLASRTQHADARQDLQALALRYEHLAERAKAAAPRHCLPTTTAGSATRVLLNRSVTRCNC